MFRILHFFGIFTFFYEAFLNWNLPPPPPPQVTTCFAVLRMFLILKYESISRLSFIYVFLTLTLLIGAIFGPIQSKIDAADNSYCQETSLTGIRPIM